MELIKLHNIESRIVTVRGAQVMVDSDLAVLFQVETKVLNQVVKRNIDRFPESFRFQLTGDEFDPLRTHFVTLENEDEALRSQSVTLKSQRGKHKKYLSYVFTEQGVAMLSAVLRSDVAVQVSIQIMQAFVTMRKFLVNNASVFQRFDAIELKQLKTDEKLEHIFKALEAGQSKPDKGIFFEGQIFDAYVFVADLIKNAQKEIVLIDNYVDETVLNLLTKRANTVSATIYTKQISKHLQLDLDKHNAQYPTITIKMLADSHDRFLIIDSQHLYHIGASLKDLGKKWFAFSQMNSLTQELIKKLK